MTLSRNLRYYRKKAGLNRQRAALALGLEPGQISLWEAGKTQPEAALLPKIARLYGISVDALFTGRIVGCGHSAQHLAEIFDGTHCPEDFCVADAAFRQLRDQEELTAEDLRQWAMLQQTMMDVCMERALSLYANLPDFPLARRQYIRLLIRLGKSLPELTRYLKQLQADGQDVEEWISLISAFQEAGRTEDALHWLELARDRFPENPMLCYWGGIICQSQDRWEEALRWWEQALTLDSAFTDAAYARAECLERLGRPAEAAQVWSTLAVRLEAHGCAARSQYPKKQARQCQAQLG